MLIEWIRVKNSGFDDVNGIGMCPTHVGQRPDQEHTTTLWEVRTVYHDQKTYINVFVAYESTKGIGATRHIKNVGQLVKPGYVGLTEALEQAEMTYIFTPLEYMAALSEETR